ncbi:MAG TPA: hypothetical protein VFA33_30200 [Bryobacteraceae bacterium]|nr:hypothetical protein [Bryobacteraceae bacterium]
MDSSRWSVTSTWSMCDGFKLGPTDQAVAAEALPPTPGRNGWGKVCDAEGSGVGRRGEAALNSSQMPSERREKLPPGSVELSQSGDWVNGKVALPAARATTSGQRLFPGGRGPEAIDATEPRAKIAISGHFCRGLPDREITA